MPYIRLSTLLFTTGFPENPAEFTVLQRDARKRWLAELELAGDGSVEVNGIARTKNDLLQALDECLQKDRLELHLAIHSIFGLGGFLETGSTDAIAWDQLDYGQVTAAQKAEILDMAAEAVLAQLRNCWNKADSEGLEKLRDCIDDAKEKVALAVISFEEEKEKSLLANLENDLAVYQKTGERSPFLEQLFRPEMIAFWRAFFVELPALAMIYTAYYNAAFRNNEKKEHLDELVACIKLVIPFTGNRSWLLTDVLRTHNGGSAALEARDRKGEGRRKKVSSGYETEYRSNGSKIYQRIIIVIALVTVGVMWFMIKNSTGSSGGDDNGIDSYFSNGPDYAELARQAELAARQSAIFDSLRNDKPPANMLFQLIWQGAAGASGRLVMGKQPETGTDVYAGQYKNPGAWPDSGSQLQVTNRSKYDAVLFLEQGNKGRTCYVRAGEKCTLHVSTAILGIYKGSNWNGYKLFRSGSGGTYSYFNNYSALGGFNDLPAEKLAFDGLYYFADDSASRQHPFLLTIGNTVNMISPHVTKSDMELYIQLMNTAQERIRKNRELMNGH